VAMSARLDGEDPGRPAEVIDEHLTGCPECRAWLAGAERLTRVVRAVPAQLTPPDLAEKVMVAVAADPVLSAQSARLRAAADAHARRQVLRLAVALAAAVQLALAVPTLVGALLGADTATHVGREMASFDVAVAVGFLAAAWRPARARAFVPVALVLAACLAVTSGVDVARGTAAFPHELLHGGAVVQVGLLWALGRSQPRPAGVPRARVAGTPR
jgi:predicted anti-sigma-YlaC factor YlaD